MIYDTKNVQVVWRGQTLSGFGHTKINISQGSIPSMELVFGIFGEFFNCPLLGRYWSVKSAFLPNSATYRMLENDNLARTQGTLVIRDLNLGTSDIFYNCFISSIGDKKDSDSRIVTWICAKRNLM